MHDVKTWGAVTIGTGLGNAHYRNRTRYRLGKRASLAIKPDAKTTWLKLAEDWLRLAKTAEAPPKRRGEK
jgi:hypothetical protein